MKIDSALLDSLSSQAKASPRLRQAYDLRTPSTGSPQVFGFSIELGRWHNTECLESGTVILECKDGKYEALAAEDIMNL